MADKVQTPADFVPMTALAFGAEGEEAKPITASNPLPIAPQYGASGVAAVTGALASGKTLPEAPAEPFRPIAGRPAYLELTGPGSAPVTLLYECEDGSYAPRAVGTDGSAPIILGKVAYNGGSQNGLIITFETTIQNQGVKLGVGTLSGSVNFALRT